MATCFPAQIVWHAAAAWPLVLAIAAVLIVGLSWLYPPQITHVRRAWRVALPLLRAAALLALAVSLLQPGVLRRRTRDERGAIVVLLDTSRSMSVSDTGRSPARRVALADGLDWLPKGRRANPTADVAAEIDALRAALDETDRARTDLGYARVAGRGVEAAQQRLRGDYERIVEATRSLTTRAAHFGAESALHKALVALSESPLPPRGREAWLGEMRRRTDAAATAAGESQRDADARLHADDAEVRAVADALDARSRLGLAQSALAGEKGLAAVLSGEAPVRVFTFAGDLNEEASISGPLRPDGLTSDVIGAPVDALRLLDERAVRAVVLFSDGRQVGVRRSVVSALPAGGGRVPVFTVNPVPPAVRDASIVRVVVPGDAFIGEAVAVRVDVRAFDLEGPATVRIDGAGVREARQVMLRSGETTPVTFTFQPATAGAAPLRVSVDALQGEATLENNHVDRWLRVLPRRLRVAAVGAPTRDFLLLCDALRRSSFVQLDAETIDPIRPAVKMLPIDLRELDVLSLTDVPAVSLSDSQWTAVNDLVVRRGGSLIISSADPRKIDGYADSLLAAPLLPFSPDYRPTQRVWPGERPAFRFAPAVGVDWLGGSLSDNAGSEWDSLPGLFRFLNLGKLKAGAAPILIEPDSGAAVATESRVGAGRTYFIGLNETWRWRHAAAPGFADRFWRQLTRHAAEAPYLADDGVYAFDLNPLSAAPTGIIHIRARFRTDATSRPTTLPMLSAQVLQQGEVIRMIPLHPVGLAGSSRFEAEISDLPTGELTVRLAGPAAPSMDLPLVIASSAEAEMTDISADERTLRAIASASGGEYLPIEQVGRLPTLLSSQGDAVGRLTETRLWDHPLFFVFVVACFGAEWSLRKRFGLA